MIRIKYTTSVFTAAGWRSVTVAAEADQISAGMATVTRITGIDGEAPSAGMSRTGARRQQYNGQAIAKREIGARKRLSACALIGVAA
jgi:hypothetical protein